MMPSRGLSLATGRTAARLLTHQYRSLSSTSGQQLRARSSIGGHNAWPKYNSLRTRVPFSVRHASTASPQPTVTTSASNPVAPPTTTQDAFPNLDTINIDIGLDQTTKIPEHIGYLSEIGVNYGWGPTSTIQWALEHIHIYGDLPWWSSILLTGFALRLITFPLYLRSSDNLARQNALVSVTKPITDRMTAAQKAKDSQATMQAWQELRAVRKTAGISFVAQLTPMFVQGVLGFCGYRLISKLVNIPVPGLKEGGFLWVSDLTLSDGYLVLPALMAGSIHLLVRMGGDTGGAQLPPGMRPIMLYGMPGIMFAVLSMQSAALCLWFVGAGSIGILQSLALRNDSVRKFFGLAPMFTLKPSETSSVFDTMFPNSPSKSKKSSTPTGPVYQAPRINVKPTRTIDTTLATRSTSTTSSFSSTTARPAASPDMVQAQSAPAQGILTRASDAWKDLKRRNVERVAQNAETRAEQAELRRAEAYEKKAKQESARRKAGRR